jgi:ribose transport system ATP-binding protein
MSAGIAFVHQELNLFDNLDVAANVFIGREPQSLASLNIVTAAKIARDGAALSRPARANFLSSTAVSRLSLAQRRLSRSP